MMNIHVVMRPVSSAGGLIPSGTIVDTSQWRNAARLLTQRYLRPATSEEAASFLGAADAQRKPKKKEGANA